MYCFYHLYFFLFLKIQFFDDNGLRIEIPKHHIHLSSDGNPSEVSLENLVNGKTKVLLCCYLILIRGRLYKAWIAYPADKS